MIKKILGISFVFISLVTKAIGMEEDIDPIQQSSLSIKSPSSLSSNPNDSKEFFKIIIKNVIKRNELGLGDYLRCRLLCKEIKSFIDDLLFPKIKGEMCFIKPFSSELLSMKLTGEVIYQILSMADKTIKIASDQFSPNCWLVKPPGYSRGKSESFLNKLLRDKPNLNISILIGEEPRPNDLEQLKKIKGVFQNRFQYKILSDLPPAEREQKKNIKRRMHNKFILLDEIGLLTGSPNATYPAYHYNVESFVFRTKNNPLNGIYNKYYEYMYNVNKKDIFNEKNYGTLKV